ncbi:MAG: bifunctional diaminohydroxyphosphoribosylaminopyrimidine deaminase/5-amino-6-(5-phosphoribosylamino)uracil reductase RibD [bacterium]|nr:bifunctional diaminohydroxyphosphoribosylaminopyrimidine deaminase/5-amino-6-(5-phosphoribosylamino)uracil reductase RibD [bacterium]
MNHHFYIKRCLELAAKGIGRTSPNPMVGAVIVLNGKIIGEGHHQKAGMAHAEVMAIKNVGLPLHNAILYVNLEPCCHRGRTGPCVEEILRTGIKNVFVGTIDPNPKVSGKGIALLKKKGVKVRVGFLEKECRRLNEVYFKYISTQQPFVLLKLAATLDGMVATGHGDSKWITSEASRERVHLWRDRMDAILVGANTVARDNPRLTTRLVGRKGKDPVRIVLDHQLYVEPTATVFKKQRKNTPPPIIATAKGVPSHKRTLFEKKGVEVLECEKTEDGHLILTDLLSQLGALGITSLMVEGGPGIHSAFLNAKVVDKLMIFFSPRFLGGSSLPMFSGLAVPQGLKKLPTLKDLSIEKIGPDILVTGYL